MKRGLIAATLSLFSLSSVSALGFGGYSNFGFGGLFSSLTIENLLEVLFFAVLFAVLYWAVGRTPLRDSTITRWIVSLGISAFTFYGISSSGFSLSEFLFQFGFDADILPTIIWMISILILLFLLIKFKLRKTFAIIFSLGGAFLILYALFGEVYQKGAAIVIGLFLLLISAFLFKKKGSGGIRGRIRPPGIKFSGGSKLLIVADGKRYTSPIFRSINMSIPSGRASRIAVENEGDKQMIWLIKTRNGLKASPTRGLIEPGLATEVKLFSSGGTQEAIVVAKTKGGFTKQRAKIIVTSSGRTSSPPAPTTTGGSPSSSKYTYKPMTRRGGTKSTKGRFVSKASVERYARRFGDKAAKKRFG